MRSMLLVSAISLTMSMQAPSKEIVTVGTASAAPLSQAVKAGGLIYLSGMLPSDTKGDIAAQTTQVLDRARAILKAAGSSIDQVVAVTIYLKSAGDFAAMNEAYRGAWTRDPPTRTTVVTNLVVPEALLEISMVAVPTGAERVVIHPAAWATSPNPYSYGIRTGDTVFLSGLVPRNLKDNTAVDGDISVQTAAVLDNANEILKAAGLTLANVVSSRIYLPDLAVFQTMNGTYRKYFPEAPPARATVKAGLTSPQYAVEITLVASSATKEVIDDGRAKNPNLSAAIRAGRRVYLAGMLGNTPETKGDAGAQTRETLGRMRTALTAAGCTPADVVDSMVYLTDLANFGAMNDAYRPFFEKNFPVRATVHAGLAAADGLVEIMATADCPAAK